MPWFAKNHFDSNLDFSKVNAERARVAGQHLNGLIRALLELRVEYPDDFRVAVFRTVAVLMRLLRDCSDSSRAGVKSR